MTNEINDPVRDLDLLWLRAELAALPIAIANDSPLVELRTFARRALLRAQTGGEDAPSDKELERLIVLLMIDRIWRSGGRMIWDMDSARFQMSLESHTSQPAAFALRLDVTRPGPDPEKDEGR